MIEMPSGQYFGMLKTNSNNIQLVMRNVENTVQKQVLYTYDLKTKQQNTLMETAVPYYLDNILGLSIPIPLA
jgi:hypothetical protein